MADIPGFSGKEARSSSSAFRIKNANDFVCSESTLSFGRCFRRHTNRSLFHFFRGSEHGLGTIRKAVYFLRFRQTLFVFIKCRFNSAQYRLQRNARVAFQVSINAQSRVESSSVPLRRF